jgi:hypothetical protein
LAPCPTGGARIRDGREAADAVAEFGRGAIGRPRVSYHWHTRPPFDSGRDN